MAYTHGWSQNTISSRNTPGMESSGLLLMGYAKEHHEWPTQKITPKPWNWKQLIFANVSPWAHGCLTLDIAQSYTHMFCEHTTNSRNCEHAPNIQKSGAEAGTTKSSKGEWNAVTSPFALWMWKSPWEPRDLEAVYIMVPRDQLVNFKWSGTSRGLEERSPPKHFRLGQTFSIHVKGTHFNRKII